MDKREMIEKIINRVLDKIWEGDFTWGRFYDALAEQAIVIECEVEHEEGWAGVQAHMSISFPSAEEYRDWLMFCPQDFPPGKAIAIILSLEKEKNGDTC